MNKSREQGGKVKPAKRFETRYPKPARKGQNSRGTAASSLAVWNFVEEFDSFGALCQAKWQYGRLYANQLISAAQVFTHLGAKGSLKKPEHETQLRPLVGLNGEEALAAWEMAHLRANCSPGLWTFAGQSRSIHVPELGTTSSLRNPERETQVRPLIGLTPQEAQAAWERAVQKAGGGKITACLVKRAVQELQLAGEGAARCRKSGACQGRTTAVDRR